MPVTEISGLVLLAVVAIGNYIEAWKQTSARYRTRKAYNEIMMSNVQLQTLDGYMKLFAKYRRSEGSDHECERLLKEGEKWITTVQPHSEASVPPLSKLEEQAAEVKALVGTIERFMEPYKKAVVGYSSPELVSAFEYGLPFFEIEFE
ncbi:hypothetical protein C0995_009540 [Termitomyces sp. Mi166|nr:hypothetical protein C0995_009540 [Termitomyces sp. Mi166\